ncbi:MAG: hypothetical protein ACLSE7_01865 [Lachnospirales bacterium]
MKRRLQIRLIAGRRSTRPEEEKHAYQERGFTNMRRRSCSMLLGLVPSLTLPAAAADSGKNEFGLSTEALSELSRSGDPYGRNSYSVDLNVRSELLLDDGRQQTNSLHIYDADYAATSNDNLMQSKYLLRSIRSDFDQTWSYSRTVAFDPFGNGKQSYVAQSSVDRNGTKHMLRVFDSDNGSLICKKALQTSLPMRLFCLGRRDPILPLPPAAGTNSSLLLICPDGRANALYDSGHIIFAASDHSAVPPMPATCPLPGSLPKATGRNSTPPTRTALTATPSMNP